MTRRSARILKRSCVKRSQNTVDKNKTPSVSVAVGSKKRKADVLEDSESESAETVQCVSGVAKSCKRRNVETPKNQYTPSSATDLAITRATFSTPHSEARCMTPPSSKSGSNDFKSRLSAPMFIRESPLPQLQWADSEEVWSAMLKKENRYLKNRTILRNHPQLQPRMRGILLDWLIEVCEVYRLHRESFYLALDFIDRYMSSTHGIMKQQLQLIGITALFIAAKLEEIYPPKITEFSYVTDGACNDIEILEQELIMLKALRWDLCPITPNSWLNVFMQLINHEKQDSSDSESSFVVPQYSQHAFVQIARLLDLCLLDIEAVEFPYRVIAAAALYHMSSENIALSVSGFSWDDIASCVQWMAPYAMTLREVGQVELRYFQGVLPNDAHNIQTHNVDLQLLEKAQLKNKQMKSAGRTSPDLPTGIITPPQSTNAKVSKVVVPDENRDPAPNLL